jgi:hypothetical protein
LARILIKNIGESKLPAITGFLLIHFIMKKREIKKRVALVINKPHAKNFHASKLTAKDVKQIRKLKGIISGVEIGKIYGVSKSTICDIFKKRYWSYVN